ncbi:MAG: glutamine-hydrolyzing carbamoyl-phosphate synthase small subunit [Magnetococcus sp. WYHC-3]
MTDSRRPFPPAERGPPSPGVADVLSVMSEHSTNKAILVLENGASFLGESLGADGEQVGEVCFNTSLTGYQEIITDPSYAGQIVTMTYTQIGNVGINPEDMESRGPFIRGFVVREATEVPSNWRSAESLRAFLVRHGIVALQGIDTRRLVRVLRDLGAQRGVLSTRCFDVPTLVERARAWPGLAGMDLTGAVSGTTPYTWNEGLWQLGQGHVPGPAARHRVAVLDFGVKRNILRGLAQQGMDLTVFPASSSLTDVLDSRPRGVFLSNGPGDPEAVTHGIELIRQLYARRMPLFGICLGHQMMGLAAGGRTYKMKFGHRGGNHPVQELASGRVEVTAQNHGFVVDEASLPADVVEVTHRSLFDGTLEGMRFTDRPAFSVQYHPEASPGPHDSHYLFERFARLLDEAS